MNALKASLGLALLVAPSLHAQTVALDPLVVSATRTATPTSQLPFSVTTFEGPALRNAATLTVDDTLRFAPSFTLFRRSGSLIAHPTTQGVSLRGLGPSGASRSLVLLDGVPLNDPFGGWVAWSKVPREGLQRAEIVRGGGSTAWGNAALGGIVQLLTDTPAHTSQRSAFSFGQFDTHSAEIGVTHADDARTVQLLGRDFSTDGFRIVADEHRGSIDVPASSRHRWLTLRVSQPIAGKLQATVTARGFNERRGNGTPYQQNTAREQFISASVASEHGNLSWAAIAYGQSQTYSSTFSAVNATRTAETPASDQFDVPSTAVGGALTASLRHASGARSHFGFDARDVRGETRENFTFANGVFTRQRFAGGRQTLVGAFAQHEQPFAEQWRALVGVRLDQWRETNGHRREADRLTGALLRDDRYADRDGTEVSPSAGLVWQPSETWRVHASGQYAFRRPTLNELYRPFRQGNDITEANADLGTEHVLGGELGVDWTLGNLKLSAVGYRNELHDAVTNVTVARGPGNVAGFGFIPAGGVGRLRLNLERVRVQGAEFSARWVAIETLTLEANYLLNDATVRASSRSPALVGRRLPGVPRHGASLGATWQIVDRLTVTPRTRWVGRQFDDDENRNELASATLFDLSVNYALPKYSELFASVENVTAERVETARSGTGVVSTGTPRFFYAGLRVKR